MNLTNSSSNEYDRNGLLDEKDQRRDQQIVRNVEATRTRASGYVVTSKAPDFTLTSVSTVRDKSIPLSGCTNLLHRCDCKTTLRKELFAEIDETTISTDIRKDVVEIVELRTATPCCNFGHHSNQWKTIFCPMLKETKYQLPSSGVKQ